MEGKNPIEGEVEDPKELISEGEFLYRKGRYADSLRVFNHVISLDPSQYFNEGYCVFRNVLSPLEMKKYQNILNGMIRRLQPGEKPQFMFEPHVGSRHWKFWLII